LRFFYRESLRNGVEEMSISESKCKLIVKVELSWEKEEKKA
jgi:hypothetical protein